jgi:hypothetical protein
MRIAKLINRRIRKSSHGVEVASDVNAAVAANVGERGQHTHVTTSQHVSRTTDRRTAKDD